MARKHIAPATMKTSIIIQLQVEGIHYWPGAAEAEPIVGFLKYPHRHMFHIRIRKNVNHSNRDIEIIRYKRMLTNFLGFRYCSNVDNCLNFGPMSCEMIAQELLQFFSLDEVIVLEDGENGAMVTETHTPKYKFVYGPIASGKSTFCSQFGFNKAVISVSSIVKELSQLSDRDSLQKTGDKFHLISLELIKRLSKYPYGCYIDGIRQTEIYAYVKNYFKSDMANYWLEVPENIRRHRFETRLIEPGKETISFEAAQAGDEKLGLGELQTILKSHEDTIIIKNYSEYNEIY